MYIYLSEFVVVCKLEEVIIRWFKGMGQYMKLSVMDNNKKKKVIGVFIIILVIAIAVLYVGSYAKYQYIENVEQIGRAHV